MSDRRSLAPLYQRANSAIREVDNSAIVFFEPLVLSSTGEEILGYTTDFPKKFLDSDPTRQSFAYHIYCAPTNNTNSSSWKAICDFIVKEGWTSVRRNLDHLGLGGFLTEFGSVGEDVGSVNLLKSITSFADSMIQSWTYWTFKGYNDITTQNSATETFFRNNGELQMPKVKALSRPYAQVTAGVPLHQSFDPDTKVFNFSFSCNVPKFGLSGINNNSWETSESSSSNITEIYVPRLHYQNKPTVETSPGLLVGAWTELAPYGWILKVELETSSSNAVKNISFHV